MELWANAVNKVEQVLPMEGPLAIPARGAIGAVVGQTLMSAIRPSFAYTESGQARKDAVFPELFGGEEPATFTPWWLGAVGGFIAFTTLI